MCWVSFRSALPAALAAVVLGCAAVSMEAEPEEPGAPAAVEGGRETSSMSLVCEVYCSDTKLRTVNARIRWVGGSGGTEEAALASAAATRPRIDATVFKNGFAENRFASFDTVQQGVAMNVQPSAAAAGTGLPAFDLRILDVEQAAAPAAGIAAAAAAEVTTTAVVEGLEPGLNYSWRVVLGGPAGEVSEVVTCEAPVCPADIMEVEP